MDHVKGILADLNSTADQRAWAQQLKDQNAFYFDAAGNWYTNAQVWDARNPKPPVNRKRVNVKPPGMVNQSATIYGGSDFGGFLVRSSAENSDQEYWQEVWRNKQVPQQESNGYVTISVKTPAGAIKKVPALENMPVANGVLIDLDNGDLGIVNSIGCSASWSVNWTAGEPKPGIDYYAEQYIGVGVTTTLSGTNSIGVGFGGGFGVQHTILFN